MLQAITSKWWVLLLRGLAAIAIGVFTLRSPELMLLVLLTYYAISVLFDGVAAVMLGFGGNEKGGIWWEMILLGVLGIAAGTVMFMQPGLTLFVLVAMFAGWAIARGVLEIAAAIRLRKAIKGEWIMILDGLLSIGLGVLVIMQPVEAVIFLKWWIGILLIVMGVVSVIFSIRLRLLKNQLAAA